MVEREFKREEIAKAKQVNQIMKHILKVEQDATVQMYQRFNKEEKELINDLRVKEKEKYMAE